MRRTFVTLFALASLTVLLGLTMILATVVNRELTARMDELKARGIGELETVLGHQVSYSSIAPSFLNYLEVRDLVIHDTADDGGPLLTIHRVRIYYSLVHLITKRDPVGALREIRVLNTKFSLDMDNDQNVIALLQRLTRSGEGAGNLRARITGANVEVELRTGGATFRFTDLFFSVDAGREALDVAVRGNCRGELPSGFTFASALGMEGRVDKGFTWSDVTMRLLSFDSSLLSASRQTLQLVWKGNEIHVHKIQDHSPIDLGMTANLDTQEISVDFEAEGLRPDRLVQFTRGLARLNPWLAAPLTASGKLTYSLKDRHLAYSGGISAAFTDQLPVHNVTLESTFWGSDKETFFSPLRFSSPVGSLQFDGNVHLDDLYPEGLLTLVNLDTGTGHKVSASFAIDRHDGKLEMQGRHVTIGDLGFDDFNLALSPQGDGTAFNFSTSFAGLPASRVGASGTLRLGQALRGVVAGRGGPAGVDPTMLLSVSLKNVPPDQLYHLLVGAGPLTRRETDIKNQLAPYSVTASFELATNFSDLSVRDGLVSIQEVGDPRTSVRFGVALDSSELTVSDFSGTWKGYPVRGALNASLADTGQVSFSADLKLAGTAYSLAGTYSETLGLRANGSYGFEIAVAPNRDGTYSLEARGRHMPVPLPGSAIALSFDLGGMYSSPTEWVVRAPSLTIYNVPLLESRNNSIGLTARLTPTRLEVSRVTFMDSYSTLSGAANATLSLPPDLFDAAFISEASARFEATLAAPAGAESYALNGTLSGGKLSSSITFSRVPIGRLKAISLQGLLSGRGSISGPVERPAVSLSVSLIEGRLGTDPLAVSADVALAPDTITVNGLKLDYLAHHLSGGAGTVNVRTGDYSITTVYAGEYFTDHVKLTARLEGHYNPAAQGPDGLIDQGFQGRLSLSDIQVQNKPYAPWAVAFHGDNGRLTFDGGPGNGVHGSIDSHLAFALHVARPLPVVGDAGGRIEGDRIVANATIVTADMLVLNTLLKSPSIPTATGTAPVIAFTSGTASGRLSFSGPFNDPDFNGELAVIGGNITSAYVADEVGPIATKLVFDGKAFRFSAPSVNAGAARVAAQASFTIDHWAPLAFDLTFTTLSDTSAHVKVRFGRMIADGHVVGTMRIAGDDVKTNVTGDISVTDCRITLGQNEVPAFVPEEVPTFLTLTARTGKRVEFAWPSENYPVIRTTASPGGTIAVTYRGDTGAYTVKGSTDVQGGEVYYFERSFILKKGTIAFNEDQQSFDPRITARAELREWDPSSGEEMRIFLDADSPLSKFTPRFSSDPPRSDTYIAAMIGAPFVARAETQGLGISAALMSSDVISQTWILRPLEQRLRDVLKLDMVSVRTQIIQNLLVQKIFGTTLNPLDNTSVSLGKYLGNDLFLEMLVRLQTPSVGVYTAPAGLPPSPLPTLPSAGIGLVPQIELNMEWATPFCLIDWSFQPQHPETMYLTDQSLSFNWRFSY